MRRFAVLVVFFALSFSARAASTINPANQYGWGANIGWTVWRPSVADGVSIGEYICSGYIYGANVGWINVGNGAPTNHIQYQNNSATDFGLNYGIDPAQPGVAILRGYAYGANIGWINFEANGNPRLSLFTGTFSGYAYSANCGWINLNDALGKVQTDSVAMGVDSDGDGIADAFEFQFFGNLTTASPTSDADGDGVSDRDEYLDGTSPIIATDRLRITAFSTNPGGTPPPTPGGGKERGPPPPKTKLFLLGVAARPAPGGRAPPPAPRPPPPPPPPPPRAKKIFPGSSHSAASVRQEIFPRAREPISTTSG